MQFREASSQNSFSVPSRLRRPTHGPLICHNVITSKFAPRILLAGVGDVESPLVVTMYASLQVMYILINMDDMWNNVLYRTVKILAELSCDFLHVRQSHAGHDWRKRISQSQEQTHPTAADVQKKFHVVLVPMTVTSARLAADVNFHANYIKQRPHPRESIPSCGARRDTCQTHGCLHGVRNCCVLEVIIFIY